MNRVTFIGGLALASAMLVGCIAQPGGDEDVDQSGQPVRHSYVVSDPSEETAGGNGGSADAPFDFTTYPAADRMGPHPEPWRPQEGPHPEPWRGVGGDQGGASTPSDPSGTPTAPGSSPSDPSDPSSSHPDNTL